MKEITKRILEKFYNKNYCITKDTVKIEIKEDGITIFICDSNVMYNKMISIYSHEYEQIQLNKLDEILSMFNTKYNFPKTSVKELIKKKIETNPEMSLAEFAEELKDLK